MKVEEYNGFMTGKVFDPQAVTLVSGNVGDPINPVSTSLKMTFTEYDEARVKELRDWWRDQSLSRNDEVSSVRLNHFFQIPCSINAFPALD